MPRTFALTSGASRVDIGTGLTGRGAALGARGTTNLRNGQGPELEARRVQSRSHMHHSALLDLLDDNNRELLGVVRGVNGLADAELDATLAARAKALTAQLDDLRKVERATMVALLSGGVAALPDDASERLERYCRDRASIAEALAGAAPIARGIELAWALRCQIAQLGRAHQGAQVPVPSNA